MAKVTDKHADEQREMGKSLNCARHANQFIYLSPCPCLTLTHTHTHTSRHTCNSWISATFFKAPAVTGLQDTSHRTSALRMRIAIPQNALVVCCAWSNAHAHTKQTTAREQRAHTQTERHTHARADLHAQCERECHRGSHLFFCFGSVS